MEKVKSIFSSCGAWIKAHLKIVLAVVCVIVVAILLLNLLGGSEKRVIKKHLSALNACNDSKVIKTMDLKAAIAWANTYSSKNEDRVDDFKEAMDDVEKEQINSRKDSIEDSISKDDKGKVKYKLLKVVYTTKAKDDKNLKKVVVKIRTKSKPDKDDDDDDKEESLWKKEKDFTAVTENYATFILYKNKIISSPLL